MQNCPKCESKTDVYDSRLSVEGEFRRKRKCRGCGYRYATIEVMDTSRPLEQEKRSAKPKEPTKPKKPVKVAKPVREKKVRRFDDDEYNMNAFEHDIQDIARELGIGDFT